MADSSEMLLRQRAIAKRIGLALAISLIVLVGASWINAPLTLETGVAICALVTGLPLAVCIARLGRLRFHSPTDIDSATGGQPSGNARILRAVLQNTLEQAVLAWAGYAAVMAAAGSGQRWRIVFAAGLFLSGRILFISGYAKGAEKRALGFALTYYPTLLLFGFAVFKLLT